MYSDLKSALVLPSFLVLMLCLQFFGCQDNAEFKENGDKYLDALEKFDDTKDSFETLTKAIKPFLKLSSFERDDELGAFLYVFPHFRPESFPEVLFKRSYGRSMYREVADVVILREDGTVFVIYRRNLRDLLRQVNKEGRGKNKTISGFRGLKGDLKKLVLVKLAWWKSEDKKKYSFQADYLIDNINENATTTPVKLEEDV